MAEYRPRSTTGPKEDPESKVCIIVTRRSVRRALSALAKETRLALRAADNHRLAGNTEKAEEWLDWLQGRMEAYREIKAAVPPWLPDVPPDEE